MSILDLLAKGVRGGVRGLENAGVARFGQDLNGLADYIKWTGIPGGFAGALMGAGQEESEGGTPEQINEAALYGGRAGALGGPLAFGPALAGTAALGPVGASPIVPWVLYTGTEARRPRSERERKAHEQEAIRRALMMQLLEAHR
jgi:hypothetical protein